MYDISWYQPQRIIYAQIEGDLSTDQLQAMLSRIQDHIMEGTAPVHILLNDTQAGKPPLIINDIKAAMKITQFDTHKLGHIVGVGDPNQMAKVVLPLIMSLLQMDFKRVATLDDALALLGEMDHSL